jgi:hypothetical protein
VAADLGRRPGPRLIAAAHPLADPRALVGEWRLEREVRDRLASRAGTLQGRLALRPAADGAIEWEERGTLRWDGRDLAVWRRYRILPLGDGWEVAFADGRPFHPWCPGESVEHLCGSDRYVGRVGGTPETWGVLWRVVGPGKDQVLRSRLTPAPG